jgi:hypothetical protein
MRKMTFKNADTPRLDAETIEIPVHLLPDFKDVMYICDDPCADMDAYPYDWLDVDD